MAAEAGRDVRIKLGSTAISGARQDSLTINRTPINITDKDDAGVQTLLDDISSYVVEMECSGVMKTTDLLDLAEDPTASPLNTLTFENSLGSFSGSFFISSWSTQAPHEDEPATFSATFTSSGTVTWTAA